MTFILETANNFYQKEDKERLEKYGFKFKYNENSPLKNERDYEKIRHQNKIEIEINTLEELLELIKVFGPQYPLIIDDCSITIYDGYIE